MEETRVSARELKKVGQLVRGTILRRCSVKLELQMVGSNRGNFHQEIENFQIANLEIRGFLKV